jgi:threonine/homoserine/homoserine lactone efflux protein
MGRLRGVRSQVIIVEGAAAMLRVSRFARQLIRPKSGFPWVRLTLGLYLMLAGTHVFFEIASGDIYLNTYSKFVNLSSWMAGALLLASAIWAEIERRTSD